MPGFTDIAVYTAEQIMTAHESQLPELQPYLFKGQLSLEQMHKMRNRTLVPYFSNDGNTMFLEPRNLEEPQ